MGIDQRMASKHRRRISEAQLIAPTLLGGFLGVLLGMIVFRHKTRKKSFWLKLLLTLIAYSAAMYFLMIRHL
jgi:uncharacterized membrane protein YsdA (DUF1294 family)